MSIHRASTRSVAQRVTFSAMALVAVVMVLVALAITLLTQRSTRAQVEHSVGETTQAVAQSLDTNDATNRELLQNAMKGFLRNYETHMELNEAAGELRSYGGLVNKDYSPMDKFAQETGGIAGVYARQGERFVLITTSLQNAAGERPLGQVLDQPTLVPALLQGQAQARRSVINGKPYMAYYHPTKDASGKVVAVVYLANDISTFEETMKKQIANTRFFAHGGLYVIDPRGGLEEAVFVVHPKAQGQKILQAFPSSRPFFEALAQTGTSVVSNADNLLDPASPAPWALVRTTQANGWWVVAQVSASEAMASQTPITIAVWGLLGLALLLLGGGLWLVLRRGVSEPLRELTQAITLVGQGDLTHRFQSSQNDEIGALVTEVEAMRQRYVHMLHQVRQAADSITTASAEIASGNQDLSSRTEHTASSLAQTAQSMELLTATVHQSADSARQANELASTAANAAARGGQVVGQVVATMNDIHDSSRRIADIIGVIDGIAFQTNILALNAAVEAARAGEQGRGFAVVAGEVRSLAGRSADAAKEIKQLIQASVDKVATGTQLVEHAGSAMDEIVSSVQRVGHMIGEISASAAEQSSGITQVNTTVNQLDQMTQQNAALVEQSAAAAHSMREQTERLVGAVQVFRLGHEAQAAAHGAALPAPAA